MAQQTSDEITALCQKVNDLAEVVQMLVDSFRGMNVQRQVNVSENADSIAAGTGTTGQVKAYGDLSKPELLEAKLKNAPALVKLAQDAVRTNGA